MSELNGEPKKDSNSEPANSEAIMGQPGMMTGYINDENTIWRGRPWQLENVRFF